nr:hypothetical protein [Tanacetum cinerariifolium]
MWEEEYCLVTGLKFGVENWIDYNDEKEPIPFRRRVFCSSLDGRPIRGKNVKTLINSEAFKTLDDNDAVSLCCAGILQLVLLGLEDRRPIPNWILRRWPALYATQSKDEVDKKSYLITSLRGHSRDISIDKRAMIENFLKIESELDYEMQSALFKKAAKLEKQIRDKLGWLQQL